MGYPSDKGRLPTGRTAALMVALVAVIGVVLWYSGYLPFRLRPDGIYGGTGNTPVNSCGAALIDRPKLYLPQPERKRSGHYRVTRVVDGDTLEIEHNGKPERIRLIGIDTDEIGRDRVDPESTGWKASMFVFDLLEPDAQVKLKYDAEREDKYGRTLAYVYLPDGRMLNEVIMKEGWARVMRIPPNTKHAEDFQRLETEARGKSLGRWR
ncbi:MAG: thermonuclease family protein [Planctomycetes bacterium]|nr:thermonuclease family protein [Planctomycetota bacterium]